MMGQTERGNQSESPSNGVCCQLPEGVKKRPLKVLVVEDSPDDAELVVHALHQGGFDTDWFRVECADAMRTALAEQSWDLVISDDHLPGFAGSAALAVLGNSRLDIPFIVVSGLIQMEKAVALMRMGANDFVPKSDLSRLLPVVERELREAEGRRMRREAEETARRMGRLLDASLDEIVVLDAETGCFLQANLGALNNLGYDMESLKGMSMQGLMPEEGRAVFIEHLAQLRSGVKARTLYETRCRRKDGSSYPVELRLQLSTVEDPPVLLVVGRDITRRLESEKRMRRLAAAVEQAEDMILITDGRGRIRYVNPSFERITGRQRSDVMNRYALSFVEDDDRKTRQALLRAVGKEGVWKGRLNLRGVDGEMLDIEANLSPVREESSGSAVNFVAVFRDATREVRLERQLLQAQKLEAIGTLTGGIAHDFNNILAAILGFTQIAMDDLAEGDPLRAYIDEVFRAGLRGRDLVSRLLTFSRLSEQERQPVGLVSLTREVLKLLSATLPPNIDIHPSLMARSDVVMADPGQIHQVLMNLCTNAGYAMRNGGGTLDVILEEVTMPNLEEGSGPSAGLTPGRYLRLVVRDTGEGISESAQERVFDPFFTTKRLGEGTGLGLSVAHGIVTGYGGSIDFESQPGSGSTFRVFLPLAVGEREPVMHEEPIGSAQGQGRQVLFVDDEPALARGGREILTRLGYRVEAVSNPGRALALVRDNPHRFDVLVTDVAMPGINGVDLARQARELNPKIPVILCTGLMDAEFTGSGSVADFDACLKKPVLRDDLARALSGLFPDA
ncbi:MAG: response regulator [Magnetococcales bacterium]|nr:response regulator [Magnetococcales bacterium]